jgi:hypothetical protein
MTKKEYEVDEEFDTECIYRYTDYEDDLALYLSGVKQDNRTTELVEKMIELSEVENQEGE